jgi:hypothetical protein
MKALIVESVLKISIYSTNDLEFEILKPKYNHIILKKVSSITILEELYREIKLYEQNEILELKT